MSKICYETPENALVFGIKLEQTRKDRFTVTYGKQIEPDLSYSQAAVALGENLMHALACEGKLDFAG